MAKMIHRTTFALDEVVAGLASGSHSPGGVSSTSLDEPDAIAAARLFNALERKRSLRVDAMIAGTAIVVGADLTTNNRADFSAFVPHGLRLR